MKKFQVKVGNNRGRTRVWLEGKRLADNGWTWGQPYTQDNKDDCVVLKLTSDGDKKVAGRNRGAKEIPIIDLAGQYLDKFLDGAEKAEIHVTTTRITIRRGE